MTDRDRGPPRDNQSPPRPSKAGAGPEIDAGPAKTPTDLRRVQGQYDPDSDSFDPKK